MATPYIATALLPNSSRSLPALAELQPVSSVVPPAAGKDVWFVTEAKADTGVSWAPVSFGCLIHPPLLKLLLGGGDEGLHPAAGSCSSLRDFVAGVGGG